MAEFIALSYNDQSDLAVAIFDIIERRSGVELDNKEYDKIEETVSSLIEYLNE